MIKITKNTRFVIKRFHDRNHLMVKAIDEMDLRRHLEEGWYIFGVNECDPAKLKYRRQWVYPDYKDWGIHPSNAGIPEGKRSYNSAIYTKGLEPEIELYRSLYKKKLYALLKKAKELMAQGLDKKTAIKIAKSCGCSH